MAVNTQFSIAVHLVAALGYGRSEGRVSAELARSVNTSPSFVRRILAKLSRAGLVHTTTGKTGACRLAKKPGQISLLDVYKAVDAPKVFAIHAYPDQKNCAVSCHIKTALEKSLCKTQKAMEACLDGINLATVIAEVKK